jgi:hypothetical protein
MDEPLGRGIGRFGRVIHVYIFSNGLEILLQRQFFNHNLTNIPSKL